MSFELTPLAKKIFLNDFKSPVSEQPASSNVMNNIFNISYPCYQMPTMGYSFMPDMTSLFMNLQNMMNFFNMPQMYQMPYQYNNYNIPKFDYDKFFKDLYSINNLDLNKSTTKPTSNDNLATYQTPNSYNNHKYSSVSVTTPYNGTAQDLNNSLKGKGLLEGKGEKLLELQKKYGVNAAFIAAIARAESGGKSKLARENNNLTGITNPGGHGFRKFKSVDECLEYTAKLIKTNYIDRNLTTIAQIHKKYCPIGADNDPKAMNHNWGFVVGSCMNEMMV